MDNLISDYDFLSFINEREERKISLLYNNSPLNTFRLNKVQSSQQIDLIKSAVFSNCYYCCCDIMPYL